MKPVVRPFTQQDANGIVSVVKSVFREYGFTWEDAYCADLTDVPSGYLQHGGSFWVAELAGNVVGCVGYVEHDLVPGEFGSLNSTDGVPRASGTDCEICRLYVLPQARGHGLGRLLTQLVIDTGRRSHRHALEIWSDKLLLHAHGLYSAMGAVLVGERICPSDPDESPEWGFALKL